MAVRNVIRKMAEEEGIEVPDFLQLLLDQCGHDQAKIARVLAVSQSAVCQALKKEGFRKVQRYERPITCIHIEGV